ncbi:hypothetical protein [Mycolicibacterium conceptionense]|nr:hypothetical protein [Mycolicibacterium conceptionense]
MQRPPTLDTLSGADAMSTRSRFVLSAQLNIAMMTAMLATALGVSIVMSLTGLYTDAAVIGGAVATAFALLMIIMSPGPVLDAARVRRAGGRTPDLAVTTLSVVALAIAGWFTGTTGAALTRSGATTGRNVELILLLILAVAVSVTTYSVHRRVGRRLSALTAEREGP